MYYFYFQVSTSNLHLLTFRYEWQNMRRPRENYNPSTSSSIFTKTQISVLAALYSRVQRMRPLFNSVCLLGRQAEIWIGRLCWRSPLKLNGQSLFYVCQTPPLSFTKALDHCGLDFQWKLRLMSVSVLYGVSYYIVGSLLVRVLYWCVMKLVRVDWQRCEFDATALRWQRWTHRMTCSTNKVQHTRPSVQSSNSNKVPFLRKRHYWGTPIILTLRKRSIHTDIGRNNPGKLPV